MVRGRRLAPTALDADAFPARRSIGADELAQ